MKASAIKDIKKLIVGITGGIGSGKTSVTNLFADLGIQIVDTDVLARLALDKDSPLLKEVIIYFGEAFKQEDGSLNRPLLRQEVFSNPAARAWLEGLVHPWVKEQSLAKLALATSPYVILVSPLLIESGQLNLVNKLVVVDLPEEEQLSRTSLRDKSTKALIEKIMQQQLTRDKRLSLADEVIDNSKDFAYLKQQVKHLHTKFLSLAARAETN